MKKFIVFLLVIFTFIFLAVLGIFYVDKLLRENKVEIENIIVNSFENCEKMEGSVIFQSYPAQCKIKNGETFVQDIGNELELQNVIRVFHPRPADSIFSPLVITGEARGNWYFEGDFPIHLLNANGKEIGMALGTAQGEWMTESFVPFVATLEFDAPILSAKGELVFEKSNPSGLSENDNSLRIPIKFERRTVKESRQKNGCIITGCSSQICADDEVITTCEYLPEYACYNTTICEKQSNGECGWTVTNELQNCLLQN